MQEEFPLIKKAFLGVQLVQFSGPDPLHVTQVASQY